MWNMKIIKFLLLCGCVLLVIPILVDADENEKLQTSNIEETPKDHVNSTTDLVAGKNLHQVILNASTDSNAQNLTTPLQNGLINEFLNKTKEEQLVNITSVPDSRNFNTEAPENVTTNSSNNNSTQVSSNNHLNNTLPEMYGNINSTNSTTHPTFESSEDIRNKTPVFANISTPTNFNDSKNVTDEMSSVFRLVIDVPIKQNEICCNDIEMDILDLMTDLEREGEDYDYYDYNEIDGDEEPDTSIVDVVMALEFLDKNILSKLFWV